MHGLYVHVPFCTKRCPYCAFVLVEGAADRRFAKVVDRHMDLVAEEHGCFDYVSQYFGGGTPSLLDPESVNALVVAARDRFRALDPVEVTLEANPEGLDAKRALDFRHTGVNRLTLGVQSLDDEELKFLGRTHDAKQGRAAYEAARAAGFKNVVVDVIFGLPQRRFAATLGEVIEWGPEHVSIYGLTVEKGTVLARFVKAGLQLPGDAAQKEDYELAMDRLGAAGYRQYELSNFARPGFESRHNSGYWDGRPYFGFGPGAHSYVAPVRWANVSNVAKYLDGDFAPMMREELTADQRMLERVFLGLRREEGVNTAAFEKEFGAKFKARYAKAIAKAGDCVEWKGRRLRLTRRGRLLADSVVGLFA